MAAYDFGLIIIRRNSPKRPLKYLTGIRPSQGHTVCDGPSCLRRSILLSRHRVQRMNFTEGSVTVSRAHDGPFCHVVAKFRELFSVPNFSEFYLFWNDTPSTVRCAHDGLSWDPSTLTVTIRINSIAQND